MDICAGPKEKKESKQPFKFKYTDFVKPYPAMGYPIRKQAFNLGRG
jgi:hypothetical protein